MTAIQQDTQQLAERGVEALLRGVLFHGHPIHVFIPFRLIQSVRFFSQCRALKRYVNALGFSIIGDPPIYISGASADIWDSPEQFQSDEKRLPTVAAGCPPDGFVPVGQLWGNPLFNWGQKLSRRIFREMSTCQQLPRAKAACRKAKESSKSLCG